MYRRRIETYCLRTQVEAQTAFLSPQSILHSQTEPTKYQIHSKIIWKLRAAFVLQTTCKEQMWFLPLTLINVPYWYV